MTSLHKSFWLGNKETFEMLIRKGADLDIEDESGDSGRSLAESEKPFKKIVDDIMGSPLAVSMTKSQAEQ